MLYKVMRDKTLRIIPPTSYRGRLFEDLHGGLYGAHLGTHYWWPGVRQYVADRCRSCAVCRGRHSGKGPIPPLTPIPVGGPFARLGVDVLKLPKTRSGKQYAIVFVDFLTKWPEVFATSGQDTGIIAKLLVEKIIPAHGVPQQLYGREAVLPTEALLQPPTERNEIFVGTYIEEATTRFSEAWTLAQENIKKAQARQKRHYDRRARAPDFQVGDRVLLYMPATRTGELRKLAMPNQGPHRIVGMSDTGVSIIPEDKPKAHPKRVAWERLRHCPDVLKQPPEWKQLAVEDQEESEETTHGDWEQRLRPRCRRGRLI